MRLRRLALTAIACLSVPLAALAQDGLQKVGDVLRALAQGPAAVPGSLVVNGSFEEPVQARGRYATVASGQSFAGWKVIGVGSVSPISGEYRQGGIVFNAHHGSQWLDLTGPGSNSAAGVEQSVRTQPGAAYELVFWVGNVSGGGFGARSSVEVYVDGQSAGTATNDRTVAGRQGWGRFRIPVTARGTTTTVAFVSRDPRNDNSNGLDAVSLTPVAGGAAPATASAAVLSESFETPATNSYTTHRAGQSFTTGSNTWSVLSGSVDVANARVRREVVAFDGTQTLDLAGSPGAGVIAATFPTTAGQTYALQFHYARNSGLGATPARARVEVIGADTLLQSEIRHDASRAAGSSLPFNGDFVADGALTTLRFTSLNAGNFGMTVDGISVRAVEAAPAVAAPRGLGGEYVYQGRGVATVSQIGDEVRMFFTWTPQGQGPHYEARGRLAGDTITGEWYSHYHGKGWFRLVGKVRPNGDIDLSQSDDPINANIRATVLSRKP